MTANNLLLPTNSLRTSVNSLRKKVTVVKTSLEVVSTELDTLDLRLNKLVTESEIYRAKVDREMGRQVRRLEKELEALRKQVSSVSPTLASPEEDLKIASTVAIIECLLRAICGNGGEDFRLISYAFIFPAVIERVVGGNEEAYFLEEVPAASDVIVRRGQEYISWIRGECETHLTDPEAWGVYSSQVSDWWRNDALPLLYGSRDENWDIDEPLSYLEMMSWRDDPGDRPLQFSSVFDAYEIYRRHKDEVYKSSGVNDYDLKIFTFGNNEDL
jgi:hypothetical protein